MDKVSLACREGSCDKLYFAEIVPVSDGFQIATSYGRRGGAMNPGIHKDTVKPVPYAKAKKIFDKLVTSKLTKDPPYKVVETAASKYISPSDQKVQSGYKPQLLCMIKEEDLEKYFVDPAYIMEEKMDGERRMAKKLGEDIFGINKKGEIVPLAEKIVAEMRNLPDCVIDGEQVGDVLFAFDCLELEGVDQRPKSVEARYYALQALIAGTTAGVQLVRGFATEAGKRKEFAAIKARRGEGVVFKERQSQYKAGRPNSGGPQVKFKFVAMATCVVISKNATKRSVSIAVVDINNLVPIGNVTILPNFPIPALGALVEVRYLYAYPNGGSLFQAVYLGERNDQTKADDVSTLKFKQGTDDEDL